MSRLRTPLDSIAFALCAHDESGCGDLGNDHVAAVIFDQLMADEHIQWTSDEPEQCVRPTPKGQQGRPPTSSDAPWPLDLVVDTLGLVGIGVTELVVESWTEAQRDHAVLWAGQQYLIASDNEFEPDELASRPEWL